MGLDDFDRALLNAWDRACLKYRDDPRKLAKLLKRRAMSTYTRPLRSWSLVLRANDSRIEENNTMGLVRMDGAQIRALCSPVKIDYPGVSLDEAARLFGVNRTTVARWASPLGSAPSSEVEKEGEKKKKGKGLTWYQEVQRQVREMSDMRWPPSTYRVVGERLMLEHFVNRANVKRSETRVWTPGFYGLDPGGAVWSPDWGSCRLRMAEDVDDSFVQQLQRVDRKLGSAEGAFAPGSGFSSLRKDPGAEAPSAKAPRARVWQWVCPAVDGGCGRLVYKLYLPMPVWSLVRRLGGIDVVGPRDPGAEAPYASAFLCQRCAGLIYESSERGAVSGRRKDGSRRRVDVSDRLVKRMSGGVLRGRDVFMDS